MSALVVLPSELSLPASLLPPRPGASLEEWNAYRKAARAAGCYRAAKAIMPRQIPVALPMVRKEAKKLPPPSTELPKGMYSRPLIRRIIAVCAQEYGLSPQDIVDYSREGTLVIARHIAMYLSRKMTKRSLPEIGRMFGGRDHTTILHGYRNIEWLVANDPAFASKVSKIATTVKGGVER